MSFSAITWKELFTHGTTCSGRWWTVTANTRSFYQFVINLFRGSLSLNLVWQFVSPKYNPHSDVSQCSDFLLSIKSCNFQKLHWLKSCHVRIAFNLYTVHYADSSVDKLYFSASRGCLININPAGPVSSLPLLCFLTKPFYLKKKKKKISSFYCFKRDRRTGDQLEMVVWKLSMQESWATPCIHGPEAII